MKKFAKILAALALSLAVFSLSSCASTGIASTGIASGELAPVELAVKDYEILGDLTIGARSIMFPGPLLTINSYTYKKILKEAKKAYPECEAVINIQKDTSVFFTMGFITIRSGAMTGTAVKFKETVTKE